MQRARINYLLHSEKLNIMFNLKPAFTLALLLLGIGFSSMSHAIEKPEYEVILETAGVEYRRYQSYIIAETEVLDVEDRNDAANEGFRRLFDYITGDNGGSEKIAMTAPVQQGKVRTEDLRLNQAEPLSAGEGWKISFMLPSSYTLADAPVPEDARIVVRPVPERIVAAVRYSGRWTEKNFDKHASRLLAALSVDGIEPQGEPQSAVYNPPFLPPFLRRNEVLVEVSGLPE